MRPENVDIRLVKTANSVIEEARRAGFDIDLIDSNLALPVEERWRQHHLALEMALELQQARIVHDAKLRSPPRPTG